MDSDRAMIARAVINGDLGVEHLTARELEAIGRMIMDEVFLQDLNAAHAAGKNVFYGNEKDTIQ